MINFTRNSTMKNIIICSLTMTFCFSAFSGAPSWTRGKCGSGPKNYDYKYTDPGNQELPFLANHKNEASSDLSWITQADYYANVKNCEAYDGIKQTIKRWAQRAAYHDDIIKKWGGVTDGGLRRHHASCMANIKRKMQSLGKEHFGYIATGAVAQTVDSFDYNFNGVFNYKDYCKLSDIPGYKPPQASSGTTSPGSTKNGPGKIRGGTAPGNGGSASSTSGKSLKMECPSKLRVSPKYSKTGITKNEPELSFKNLTETLVNQKYEYICTYNTPSVNSGIPLLFYTSTKKCEIRNNTKLYCP